jgi:hypothetical protein
MKPAQDNPWLELEPLLDDAMLTLSERQRELVLFRYFQNNTQRAAASLVGCSETVASRELAAAIESLRRFFTRHGVTVSGTALVTLLTTHGAQASIGAATVAATLSSASALAGASTAGALFSRPCETTTTTKKSSPPPQHLFSLRHGPLYANGYSNPATERGDQPAPAVARADRSKPRRRGENISHPSPQPPLATHFREVKAPRPTTRPR